MSDLPANDWDLERLGEFARRELAAILAEEKTLAPAYWRLGSALTKARKQLGRGHWLPYLESLGIEKTRSSKACAVYRTFQSVEDLAGLTVAAAYAARARPSQLEEVPSHNADAPAETPWQEAFASFEEQAARLTNIAQSAAHGELLDLLGKVRRTMDRLRLLEQELTQALEVLEEI